MMRSILALLALYVLAVVAHRDLWLASLPKCWQSCFSKTEDGCGSSRCVCDTAGDSSTYLPSVITCAISSCSADPWATKLVLGPLEMMCLGFGDPIPSDNMELAYAAAEEDSQQTTRKPAATSSVKPQAKTTKATAHQDLTTTLTSTLTRTSTDSNGNTVVVIVPIIVGPSGVSTGEPSTSTVTATSSSAPSSAAASPSPSAADFSPEPTQRVMPSTSTPGAQRTQRPANGNGSPFENMQAGASTWAVPGSMLGLSAVALLFFRL